MRVLLIDDNRTPALIKNTYNIDVTVQGWSYTEGLELLINNQPFDILLLDHDLASYDNNGVEKTGLDVMYFLEAHPQHTPKEIMFVTANPVGRQNMQNVYKRIKKGRLVLLRTFKLHQPRNTRMLE